MGMEEGKCTEVLNEKKICFIMCVNDEMFEEECIRYIKNLSIPDGYEVEQLSVWGATSMAAGYNEGMTGTDAKYKVYLHQDVFIVWKDFIKDILSIFADPKVGMIGVVGSPKLPGNGVMWSEKRIGRLFSSDVKSTGEAFVGPVEGMYQKVEAIDGLLMATQYDVTWREDLFRGWDFYDISQSMEFQRKGYEVVVPAMQYSWCLHNSELINYDNYFEWRDVFLKEYGDMLNGEGA